MFVWGVRVWVATAWAAAALLVGVVMWQALLTNDPTSVCAPGQICAGDDYPGP